MYYQTQLRYKVWKEVRGKRGLFRVRGIAKKMGERANSVLYQLKNLLKQGIVQKVGNMYAWSKWVNSRGGKEVIKSMINGFKGRIEVLKNEIQLLEKYSFYGFMVGYNLGEKLQRMKKKYEQLKNVLVGAG